MLDARVTEFETTVLSAPELAQNELISDGMENSKMKFPWVKKVVVFSFEKTFWRYSTTTEAHTLGSSSLSKWWCKTLMQWTNPRCGLKNTWSVFVWENLSRDLFDLITMHRTSKCIKMVFTTETKVQCLFCEIMDCEIEVEKFLKKSASVKGGCKL